MAKVHRENAKTWKTAKNELGQSLTTLVLKAVHSVSPIKAMLLRIRNERAMRLKFRGEGYKPSN